MKRLTVPVLRSLVLTATGAVTLLTCATSAIAQTGPGPVLPFSMGQIDLGRVAADLAYPNSSQRFFEAGLEQFEEEIQRLLAEEDTAAPLLTVQPDVLEEFLDENGHR